MDSAAVDAACDLIFLAGCFATLAGVVVGLIIGYVRWGKPKEELISEEEIPQLFPEHDPLTWGHLSVPVEQEQAL